MSKSVDSNDTDLPVQSDGDVASLLIKMQRQLAFLEKKIDILISQSQEKPYRSNSSYEKPYRSNSSYEKPYRSNSSYEKPYRSNSSYEKPYRKKTFTKPFRSSKPSRSHETDEHGESSGEKNQERVYYSRFRKSEGNRGAGPSKKPYYHKQKKRK